MLYLSNNKLLTFPGIVFLENGGFPSAHGPVHIGGNDCTEDRSRYFVGQIDSVSMKRFKAVFHNSEHFSVDDAL